MRKPDQRRHQEERPRLAPRIVVGVDGSENSIEALRWALDEGLRRDASVEAVFACLQPYLGELRFAMRQGDRDPFEREAVETLEHAVEKACPDVQVRDRISQCLVHEAPTAGLLQRAEGAELLVVGARGRGGFLGLILGSTSTQCVNHAPCPVVVVPARH